MSKCNCPICHRECNTEDTVIIDTVTKSQHLNTKIRGRKVVSTYMDTHYYVRECKRCASLQKWIKYIINITIFVVFGILFFDPNDIGMSILGGALMIFLVWLIFGNLLYFIIYKIFFEPDIDYAYDHNALATKDEFTKIK